MSFIRSHWSYNESHEKCFSYIEQHYHYRYIMLERKSFIYTLIIYEHFNHLTFDIGIGHIVR